MMGAAEYNDTLEVDKSALFGCPLLHPSTDCFGCCVGTHTYSSSGGFVLVLLLRCGPCLELQPGDESQRGNEVVTSCSVVTRW